MDRILLTGFEPFLTHTVNPSARLVETLDGTAVAGAELIGVQLPVAYGAADAALAAALERVRPSAVLLFGLAFETDAVRLERVALNLDDSPHADNSGTARRAQPIVADGPVGYWSSLPLDSMAARLEAEGFPVTVSRDAGGYLCNHVFFQARHWIATRGLDIPAGFVHVPPLPEQLADRPDRTGMPLDRLAAATRLLIEVVRESRTPMV